MDTGTGPRAPGTPPPASAGGPTAPGRIPASGWAEVLGRTGRRVLADRLPQLCAAVAFFAVLSVAPVLVTALSVYGVVSDPEQALARLSSVAGVLPDQLEPVVADQLVSITTASTQVLTWRGLVALLFALWTATMAAVDLIDALTVAYHERETRGFLRRSALALAFVLGGALLLGGVLALVGAVSDGLGGASDAVRATARVLVWPALAVLMAAVLAVLYRFAPDRRQARWRWISWGAAAATALWVLSSAALFAWVQHLGTYEATYGSLAGVAISMLWLWVTVLLVVAGAVLNAEAERQTAHDSTVGPERPVGRRGAVVADSVPPYPAGG